MTLPRGGLECGATIAVAHEGVRSPWLLRCDGATTPMKLRRVIERAMDMAAQLPHRQLTSSGWWAIMVGAAAGQTGPCELLRVPAVGSLHAELVVERSRMLDPFPLWPLARFAVRDSGGELDGRPWHDLRTSAALACGPGDDELRAYVTRMRLGDEFRSVHELRRLWEMGALQWGELPTGRALLVREAARRMIVSA